MKKKTEDPSPEQGHEVAADPVGALGRIRASDSEKVAPLLQHLGDKMRAADRADGMPATIYQKNGGALMQEEFADNAFAYVSIQLMQPGARDDGWHTDGGCSLLHASVTLFGTRSVEVKVIGKPQVTLDQEPGSFYVGNLSALEHNVRHHEECKHTFDGAVATAKGDGKDFASVATAKGDAEDLAPAETAKGDQRLQIAVMIRCDVFRDSCRAATAAMSSSDDDAASSSSSASSSEAATVMEQASPSEAASEPAAKQARRINSLNTLSRSRTGMTRCLRQMSKDAQGPPGPTARPQPG